MDVAKQANARSEPLFAVPLVPPGAPGTRRVIYISPRVDSAKVCAAFFTTALRRNRRRKEKERATEGWLKGPSVSFGGQSQSTR